MDITGLANAVAPVLGLSVHGGVPVAVVEDDGVGTRQVDTDAAAAGREDEAEDALVGVEPFHQGLQEAARRRPDARVPREAPGSSMAPPSP